MSKRLAGMAFAAFPLIVAAVAATPSFAAEVEPHGSVTTVTTALTGAGQDLKQTLVDMHKVYWDEIYDYPVEQDTSGNLVPGLALSWTASEDKLTWTFVLRDDVIFHNGDHLTGDDAAWSWNRLIFDPDSKHNLAGFAPEVDSITAEGNKVFFKTKTPQALVPLWLAKVEGNLGGSILDKKYYEAVGPEEASLHPIGTGPFKFVSGNGEQSATLTAFDDPNRSEWQKSRTPAFKDLTVLAVPESSTRSALLKTGAADLVPLPLSAVEDIKSQPGLRVVTVPSTNYAGIWCLGFTLNPQSPCNDQRVREALSIAIDRATIADVVYLGQAEPSGGFYGGPGSFGYPKDLAPPPFDPERAQALLTEAGYGPSNPLKVQVVTYNDDVDFPMLPTLAEAIVGYYESIGLDASIQIMDWDAQKDRLLKGLYPGQPNESSVSPVVLFMRGMDNRFYFPAEQMSAYTGNTKVGASIWDNDKLPEQRRLLDEVAATFDLPTQERLFGEYDKWMAENYNQIPLLAAASAFGVSSKIKDWSPIAGKPFVTNQWTLIPAE